MAVTLDDGDYAIQRRSFSHAFDIFMLLAQDGVAVAEYKLAKMCADGQLNNAQLEILIARLDPKASAATAMPPSTWGCCTSAAWA
ncbi:MAG: hypothetical protein MO847_06615 [Candidatus Protistobacter heckmanni]|nr:hypothetical protein [Candidatus Protistobacter heckmanni]